MPPDMRLIHASDLDVWERPTAWPRAFFVDRALEVRGPSDILKALEVFPHRPFGAVESRFIPAWAPRGKDVASVGVRAARGYALTGNSTRFSVDAPGPGLIVLTETYYPGDFIARMNGERVDYVRVNQAFKGIWVRKAGTYRVEFTYRPSRLFQAMVIAVSGALVMVAVCLAASRPAASTKRRGSCT